MEKTSQKQIQIPHNFSPRSYQLKYLQSKCRFKIIVYHRRGGKSKVAFNEQIRKAQITKGVYYYIFPTYRQAKQVIFDKLIGEHVPPEIILKRNDSELAIYYKNGSIQRFVGCEDIDKHRGVSPIDVVFDEYSEMNPKMWEAIIQPILRENGGTATFCFTPKGKNHAYALIQKTKDNPDWFYDIQTVYDTEGLPPEEVQKAKEETPEALFRQEYLCSFEDGAGMFFRGVRQCIDSNTSYEIVPSHPFNLGIDLAKYNDWTVLTPFDKTNMRVFPQDRFNQVDWNLQEARIGMCALKHNNALLRVDSTGVGDPIAEGLRRIGLNMDDDSSFKFTSTSKINLLNNLAILIEQRKITLPNDDGLINELESIKITYENGVFKAETPSGMTDDRVMSLALAVWKVSEPVVYQDESFALYTTRYR